jgi:starvation-inducible DNA-binding protein
MSRIKSSLSDAAQKTAGAALQGALVDMIDLSLAGKQAHWNVYGHHFRSLHLELDEIVTHARTAADTLAERAVAIGLSPDGRAGTIAAESSLPALSEGPLPDSEVVTLLVDQITTIVSSMRERIDATADPDPVTQDLLIGITAELEKQSWMLQAQQD